MANATHKYVLRELITPALAALGEGHKPEVLFDGVEEYFDTLAKGVIDHNKAAVSTAAEALDKRLDEVVDEVNNNEWDEEDRRFIISCIQEALSEGASRPDPMELVKHLTGSWGELVQGLTETLVRGEVELASSLGEGYVAFTVARGETLAKVNDRLCASFDHLVEAGMPILATQLAAEAQLALAKQENQTLELASQLEQQQQRTLELQLELAGLLGPLVPEA